MATKTLIVWRHAKSSWETAEPDIGRPLSERGVLDAQAGGEVLRDYQLDTVLCSSATRARQTWENAVAGGAKCADVRFSEAIYYAWPGELLVELQDLAEQTSTALLIGHQPTLSDLVLSLAKPGELTGAVEDRFPTCAMSVLSCRGAWYNLGPDKAVLTRYEIPRG